VPPEPVALLKASRLVACGALTLAEATRATGASEEELDEMVRALEEQETQIISDDAPSSSFALSSDEAGVGGEPLMVPERLARQLSSKLRSGRVRHHRPPRFMVHELDLLGALGCQWPVSTYREWHALPATRPVRPLPCFLRRCP